MTAVDDDQPDDDDDDLREILGMSARRAPATLTVGQVIDGTYRIDAELGQGGMGRVYRAHDLKLERDVAIKLHAIPLARDDDSLRREGVALAKLTHPNVVTVYEVGAWGGHPWVAMEYVPGGTARSWCRTRTLRERLGLYLAAGRGLVAAHAVGLVHRDFKPDNVLVGDDGRPRIADFGLAGLAGVELGRDATSGTPGYMAPEQEAGKPVDARTDQFAFAVALREALEDAVPPHVAAALGRATALDPGARWPDMAALLVELERDPARTRRRWLAGTGLAAGAIALAGGFAWWGRATASATCDDGSAELALTWSPARRAALAPGLVREIEGWTARWRTERTTACEATHVAHKQSPTMFDLRIACLDRARVALGATLDVLADPALKPANALDAVAALPDVSECAEVAALALRPSEIPTPASAALDARIELSSARRAAGDAAKAIELARDALDDATRDKLPVQRARAALALAYAHFANGEREPVIAKLEEAARLAALANDEVAEAQAWLNLVDVLASHLDKADQAVRLRAAAESAVLRAGVPAGLQRSLVAIDGNLAMARADFAAAVPLFEQRIAAIDAAHVTVDDARWYNRLAGALQNLQRHDEALATLTKGIRIVEDRFGASHPYLGILLTTRANTEQIQGHFDLAIEGYRRALAIKEATVGPTHPSLLATLVNLALAERELGHHDEALVAARRAVEIAAATFPAGHPRIAMALAIRASMEIGVHANADAAVTIEQARAVLEPLGDKPPLDEVYDTIADLAARRGDLAAARSAQARAVAIARATHGDSMETARVLSHAARIAISGGDRTGLVTFRDAIAMAEKTLGATHTAVQAMRHELSLIEAALAKQPATAPPR